jgi:hypothetical protein
MATPALALLAGLGAEALWATRRRWLQVSVVLALSASAAVTARDYFGRWANDPHLFVAFDAGLERIAAALRQAPAGAALYETPVYRDYPTFEYTLGPEAYGRFRAFNGRACTVLPAVTRAPTTYAVIVTEDDQTLPALQAAFPGGALTRMPDSAERDYAALYAIPAGKTARVGAAETPAEFGELMRLRDYRLGEVALAAGETLQLALTWELMAATPAQLSTYVHVIGPPRADGSIVYAQIDREPCDNAYPTWQWQAGELLIEKVGLALPGDLPAGTYDLTVGWYDTLSLARLPVTSGAVHGSGSFQVGTLVIEAR